MHARITEDERRQIRDLLAQGLSSEEVSRRLGVPKMRVAAIKAHTTMGTYEGVSAAANGLDITDLEDAADAQDLKFGLERDMQDALRRNIQQLHPTLQIVDDGRERHVEAGFIDILAEDDQGHLVVIELKSGEAPESAITQVLAYVGSLQGEEPSRSVRGVLIARDFPTKVKLARARSWNPTCVIRLQLHLHTKAQRRRPLSRWTGSHASAPPPCEANRRVPCIHSTE